MVRVLLVIAIAVLLGVGAVVMAHHGATLAPIHDLPSMPSSLRAWEPEAAQPRAVRAGDIVFQTSDSTQSRAIRLATHSSLTDVGMVAHAGDRLVVLEAEGTVKATPLEEWTARSPTSFVAERLKDSVHLLTPEGLGKIAAEAKKQIGKPYDVAFDWSDSRMYCSELVWKVFHAALGVDLGEPKPLRSFDLTSPEVHAALAKRYGRSIPLDSVMIAPQQIYDSDLLEWVQGARPETRE
jgi:hypothetical protein